MEALERERGLEARPDCLGDSVLERLALGSLPRAELELVVEHLRACTACMHAYAVTRSLLEMSEPELSKSVGFEPAARRLRPGARWREHMRRMLAWRIPAGWAIAPAVAAVLLTWMVTSTMDRPTVIPIPMNPGDAGSPTMRGLSQGPEPRTVRGMVATVQEATTEGIETHVVTVKDGSGPTYVIFVWGRPAVRPGELIEATGVFTAMNTSGEMYKGVASRLVSVGERK
jgi:hypothetical protein